MIDEETTLASDTGTTPASGDNEALRSQPEPQTSRADGDTSADQSGDQADPTPEEQQARANEDRKRRSSERFQELVRQRDGATRIADQELAEAQYYRQQLEQNQPRAPHEYDSDADYLRDLSRQALAEQRIAEGTQRAQEAQQAAQAAMTRAWEEKTADAREKYKDFDYVVYRQPQDGGPTITPLMLETIAVADQPGELAYYLGKNPSEAHRIAQMSPGQQAREIIALEQRIAQPHPRSQTQTPPPVETVSGRTGVAKRSLESMSYEQFKKARGYK